MIINTVRVAAPEPWRSQGTPGCSVIVDSSVNRECVSTIVGRTTRNNSVPEVCRPSSSLHLPVSVAIHPSNISNVLKSSINFKQNYCYIPTLRCGESRFFWRGTISFIFFLIFSACIWWSKSWIKFFYDLGMSLLFPHIELFFELCIGVSNGI